MALAILEWNGRAGKQNSYVSSHCSFWSP